MTRTEKSELIRFACATAFKRDDEGILRTTPHRVECAMETLLSTFEARQNQRDVLHPYPATLRSA